jgi:hypothetical protein
VNSILLVLSLIFVSGCSTKYVCYDGTVQKDISRCPVIVQPKVLQRQAENAASNFASAYAQALGARQSIINTYREGANWESEVLFTVVKTGDIYRLVLEIDGQSARVSCVDNCDFLDVDNEEELNNQLNESLNQSQNNPNDGSGFSVY